jgi:plastocyanin
MTRRHRIGGTGLATLIMALGIATAAPLTAQSEEADGPTIVVTGVEYAFQDLPTSVPAGTSLGFTNAGVEVHELALARIADGVTESIDELMAMEEDPVEAGLVEIVGEMPLFAAPGAAAEGTLLLDREGRYVAVCFIPQGLTDMSLLEGLGPETNPEDVSPELAAIMANPPHIALGMVQEFMVTAADSSPGPLPAPVDEAAEEGAAESPAAESPAAESPAA